MKKRMFAKKFTAVSLAAVMAFGGAGAMIGAGATAWADDQTITITNPDAAATYTAYQIFTGDVDGNTLKNIAWGNGVNSSAFLTALQNDTTFGTGTANVFANATTAAEVAQAMSGWTTDSTQAKRFAELALANKATATTMSSNVLSAAPGYYVIEGTAGDSTKYTATSPILKLNGNLTVTAKNGEVTLDKDITGVDNATGTQYEDKDGTASSGHADANDYSIGDNIPHEVTGTLPANLKDFKYFRYQFSDVMDKGLTFNNDLTVKLHDGTNLNNTPLTGSQVNSEAALAFTAADTDMYKYYYSKDTTTGVTTLLVHMNPYKMPTEAAAGGKVVLNYSTQLNSDAVIGGSGNKNIVKLKFENNPNSDGSGTPGETPQDENIVFTYELDNTKIDGTTSAKLKDAKFVLRKQAANGDKYAYSVISDGKHVKWVEATDAEMFVNGDSKQGLKDTITIGTETYSASDFQLTSADNTGRFDVKGLDAGAYTLVETAAPTGYAMPTTNTFNFEIQATVNKTEDKVTDDASRLEALKIKVGDKAAVDGNKSNGTVAQDIENNSESDLPSTGGMGTVAFTIVGVALMGSAIVITVTRRRREQQ